MPVSTCKLNNCPRSISPHGLCPLCEMIEENKRFDSKRLAETMREFRLCVRDAERDVQGRGAITGMIDSMRLAESDAIKAEIERLKIENAALRALPSRKPPLTPPPALKVATVQGPPDAAEVTAKEAPAPTAPPAEIVRVTLARGDWQGLQRAVDRGELTDAEAVQIGQLWRSTVSA